VEWWCSVSAKIEEDFETLLIDDALMDSKWEFLTQMKDDDTIKWSSIAVIAVLCPYVDYKRRIGTRRDSWPNVLAWLVWEKHDVDCPHRRKSCLDLIAIGWKELFKVDVTTAKILVLFEPEIVDAAEKGTCCPHFWQLIDDICERIGIHTQRVEGMNNTVKCIVKRAPGIAWWNLSDKVLCSDTCRHLHTPEMRTAFVDACASVHMAAMQNMSTRYGRWTEVPVEPRDAPHVAPASNVSAAHRRAAKLMSVLAQNHEWDSKHPDATIVWKLEATVDVEESVGVWLFAHLFRAQRWMVKLHQDADAVRLRRRPAIRTFLCMLTDLASNLDSKDHDVTVTKISIAWDRRNLHEATVLDVKPAVRGCLQEIAKSKT